MARIRSIHPGFATDENFITVSIPARLCFLLLLTECDDQGMFEWKPKTLKMRLFPADNVDVDQLLVELIGISAISIFGNEADHKYGAVRNFRKFQRPKSPNAIHPITDEIRNWVGLSPSISEINGDHDTLFPRNGEISPQMEEGGDKREEGEGKKERVGPRGARLAADWVLPEEWRNAAEQTRVQFGLPPCNVPLEAAKFRDYWHSKPGKDGVKLDWRATWLNWIRRADSKPQDTERKPFPGFVPQHPGAGG